MLHKTYRILKEYRYSLKWDIRGRIRRGELKIGNNTKVSLTSLVFSGESVIHLGENCNLLGRFVCRLKDSCIEVGNRCFIASGVIVLASRHIQIGSDVMIGDGCYITDNDGHALDPELRAEDVMNSFKGQKNWEHVKMAPVVIEDHVWIAPRCLILKGVRIGRGSVIAAGSVVTRDVPGMSLAGGNPAKVIKSLTP